MDAALIHLLEWRHTGHRLAYARAVADAASESLVQLHLHTTEAVVESREYQVHLSAAPTTATRTHAPARFRGIRLIGLIRSLGPTGVVVIPEADRSLPLLTAARLVGLIRSPMTLILMQPPHRRSAAGAATSVLKVVAVRILTSYRRSVDLLFLEDPLANDETRVWRSCAVQARQVLYDPIDLVPLGEPDVPPELAALDPRIPVASVVGFIDERKRVPLVLEAWRAARGTRCWFWPVGSVLGSDPPSTGRRRWTPRSSSSIATSPMASSISSSRDPWLSCRCRVVTSPAARSWPPQTRCLDGRARDGLRGRAAVAAGIGIGVEPAPGPLAEALSAILTEPSRPRPPMLPDRADFGRRVIELAERAPTPPGGARPS